MLHTTRKADWPETHVKNRLNHGATKTQRDADVSERGHIVKNVIIHTARY
jgi:hypothetical protein